jgi:hypothetical protein
MRYIGNKRIIPYYEDYKPLERYRNNVKIAGWENSVKSGEGPFEWDGTYNDKLGIFIGGKSVQAVTVQGKNLLDPFDYIAGYLSINGTTAISGKWVVFNFAPILSNTVYTISRLATSGAAYIILYDVNKNITSTILQNAMTKTFTTGINDRYIRFSSKTDVTYPPQLELGSAATAYEPFTPNSPSPDYPSPIINASGTIASHGSELFPAYEPTSFTFADLAAIPLPANATEWTYIDGNGQKWWADTEEWGKWDGVWRWKRTVRCGKVIFNGTETWLFYATNAFSSALRYTSVPGVICTHYVYDSSRVVAGVSDKRIILTSPENANRFLIKDSSFSAAVELKTFNAAQYAAGTPVTVLYQLATPIITYHDDPPLLTYPRYTHVEQVQDGLKAWMDLSCKVVD